MASQLGIRIKYSRLKYGNSVPDPESLHASFYIDRSEAGKDFVSTVEIRNAISEIKAGALADNWVRLGHIEIAFNPLTRTGTFYHYYPIGAFESAFLHKGIAQFLELKVLLEMKKRYPSLSKIRLVGPNKDRKTQYEKRGMDPLKTYSYKEAVSNLKKKIRKNAVEKRGIRRTSAVKPRNRKPMPVKHAIVR